MKALLETLQSTFSSIEVQLEEEKFTSILLHNPQIIVDVMDFLKEKKFRLLIDICGVDYPSREKRFEVVYQLLNIEENTRFTLKVQASEEDKIPSVESVFSSATWFQRETFDMYGIVFSDASDLRRILTDYNFEGFPLRKDFPLSGNYELKFDPTKNEIVRTPVNLSQEYRDFDFETPWEMVQYSVKKS